MSLRKNRIPFHGTSNFRMTQTESDQKYKPVWNTFELPRQKENKGLFNDQMMQKNLLTRNKSQPKDLCLNNKAISLIRKAYKNRPNVWRIAKAWKFAKNGYISSDQFKQNIKDVVGTSISNEQVQQIVQKVDKCNGKIDIQTFLKIIYGESNSYCFKPRLFDINDKNINRESKIDNLIDKLDIYQDSLKKKTHRFFRRDLNDVNGTDLEIRKSQPLNFQKPNHTKSQSSIKDSFSKEQFMRITQSSFTKLKNKELDNLYPESMLNKNQTKTRFGATVYTTNEWYSQNKKIEKIDKNYNIALTQKLQKEMKLNARIQKVREMENGQKQNIRANQMKLVQKENNRLIRKKLDREAYDYSSFIRNKWL